ncbi:C40 family peptidase [Lactobacillus johnsonii]|uniref:NlpC/P60 family protein n=1 Tax=Lactobacillus johnsonii TaxID=33959 RepID=A0A9W3Z278_LACJH|nr:C40 family peptidase [Lactobacillus johnsonii]AZZ68171.1 peptidoglycan endopeptidase [Lactobacillus johnsonii]MCI7590321.1 NlpC/P60 family protein [Lactobacillus johnsonii]MCR1915161.1 NlpC/P60 family protein [Lactobacillus johnsonii]MDD7746650.1 NlpC/P60 family protein [Lactobacillus johnsonii]MDY2874371.1 NlpC/P60 family protein [Lactobacillus johnsonii]
MTIKSKVIKFTTAASFAVAGIATLSAAKLNSLSFNGTAQASTLQAPAKEIGVVKVNSKTGESIAVWNSYEDGKQQTGKYLPYQSSWKTYKKVKTVKGETWYNLGGNQWISSDNVEEEAPIAVTADLSAVATAVSQVPAANVNNAQQATAPVAQPAQQAATTTANTVSVATTAPVQTNTAANVQQAATTTANTASVATTAPVQTNTAANVQQATASVAQPAQQTATTTASANTQAAPAQTNYVQTNTAATTKQASTAPTQSNTTYTAPAQNNTAAKPAQQQAQPTQQASSQAATTQTAKPQASTQSNSSTAQTVVSAAQSQIGKPYVWGATGPNAYDCSGLVQYAYSQAGKNVGRTTYQQAGAGQHISVSQAQAGDILMWGDYHDAIYVGNNQYVHAPQPGQNVTQASISSYFMPDYAIRVN